MTHFAVCGLLLIGPPVAPVAQQPVDSSAVADSKFNELAGRYRSILQNRPQRGTAFDQWHRLYLDAGRLDELVTAVEKEASDKPDDFAAQMVLGLVSERCGRADQAAQAYARAERLAPENYYPPYLRGSLLAQESRLDEATAALQRAIERGPPRAELLDISKRLARVNVRQGKSREALDVLARIADRFAGDRHVLVELAELHGPTGRSPGPVGRPAGIG